MKTIGTAAILFLMGFVPEMLLLKLDDGWKLLGLAYPIATSIVAFNWVSGFGMDICWMPALGLLIVISPFFVGIAAAIVLWLLAWTLKTVPRLCNRLLDQLLDWLLKGEEE